RIDVVVAEPGGRRDAAHRHPVRRLHPNPLRFAGGDLRHGGAMSVDVRSTLTAVGAGDDDFVGDEELVGRNVAIPDDTVGRGHAVPIKGGVIVVNARVNDANLHTLSGDIPDIGVGRVVGGAGDG